MEKFESFSKPWFNYPGDLRHYALGYTGKRTFAGIRSRGLGSGFLAGERSPPKQVGEDQMPSRQFLAGR